MDLSRLIKSSAARYLVAGGVAFVFNVALLNILREGFGWSTSLAALVAFWGTFGFSYGIQRIFAFSSQASIAGSVVRYSVLVAFNSLVVAGVVTASHEYFGQGLGTSQLIATVLTTTWNYFVYKHWVYAKPKPKTDQPATAEAEER